VYWQNESYKNGTAETAVIQSLVFQIGYNNI